MEYMVEGWMNGDGWVNGWMNKWVIGWKDKWMATSHNNTATSHNNTAVYILTGSRHSMDITKHGLFVRILNLG